MGEVQSAHAGLNCRKPDREVGGGWFALINVCCEAARMYVCMYVWRRGQH